MDRVIDTEGFRPWGEEYEYCKQHYAHCSQRNSGRQESCTVQYAERYSGYRQRAMDK